MSFLLIFQVRLPSIIKEFIHRLVQAGINYLIDSYTKFAASAIAGLTFFRSIFAAALPLVAEPLFRKLGGLTILSLAQGTVSF